MVKDQVKLIRKGASEVRHEVAQRFGRSANWTRDVTRGALALVCLTAGKTLSELCDDDFAASAQALAEAPTAGRESPSMAPGRPADLC
jgi:hypothetical protein